MWITQGGLLKTLTAHQTPVWAVAFSPPRNLLVSGSGDGTAKLWQLDGSLIRTLQVDSPVKTLACLANGEFIATGRQDRLVNIWHPSGTLINTLN